MVYELEEESEYKKNDNNNGLGTNLKLADRVCVFCSTYNKGIMFYDQSPTGVVAKLIGTLPEGKFWSSGEQIVEWDESINGKVHRSVPVTDSTSFQVKKTKSSLLVPELQGGGIDSFNITTIIISENNFIKLLHQIKTPNIHQENGYKILDVNSRIYYYDNYNDIKNLGDNIDFEIKNKKY